MMGRSCFLLVIVLLRVFTSLCVHGEEPESLGYIRCKKHEQEALLKFKQSFTKDPLDRLSSWVGQDCCQWHGVTCDNVTHNVIKLNLRSLPRHHYDYEVIYDITDCLPDPQVSMVSFGVSSALLKLKLLTHLDLSGNNFSRSRIPEFIGSMSQLRYLNLSSAGFSGPLPPQLGNLTNLVHLDLHVDYVSDRCYEQNALHNALHIDAFRWTSGLLKLQSLDISSHNLSRAHDTFKVLMTLPSLSSLSLSNCWLQNSHLSEPLISNTSNTFFSTLQHLDLSFNDFEGPLPSVLKTMVFLRSLSLSHNNFSGPVPLWFRAMRRLEVLDLSSNSFNYVEGGIMGIMGNPCNLKHLDLSYNFILQEDILDLNFTSSSVCAAFELEYLDLYFNAINGSLPPLLGQLTNLKYLDLSENNFKGQIPASYVKLAALTYLDLSDNQLSGLIPDFIPHLTEIEHLDISSNSLQGTVFDIGNLPKLSYLDMGFNNLSLNLNSSVNWKPPFQLRVFNVRSCVINTVFPQWLKNQTQIIQLDLSYTGISGELPGWLWNSSYLRELHLFGNQLTGSLRQHKASDGRCFSCNLEVLDLHNNLLTGTIPNWLGHLENIQVIDLSSNQLSGAIFEGNNGSSLLDDRNSLWVLDLGDNLLSGEIQFGKVLGGTGLEFLSLRKNHFNGPIRSQLCNFGRLMVLELAHNRLTGHIPRCLGSMQFHSGFVNDDVSLQIQEFFKGIVELTTGSEGMSIIDLSSNHLVGTIPEELTNISILFALNLSYNHLTGHIPDKIGNLQELESLDLSNNRLSGTIPESLSSISWLSKLNLSNNHLHGLIPSGSQLQTLDDPSIYAGNSGLCGFPLSNNCTEVDAPPSSTNGNPTAGKDDVKEDKYDKMWFILAVMSGVATGFWGVVGTLVIKRGWRQAYFRYVEDLADRIYVSIKVRVNRFKRRFNENS
ncbi:receptor-like protein EIX2 [Silene latifolia]|uniref:receptor-like protein EIX2 n=1 Tax=Silene latifolia TaxID=37657 RepID=UPI003D77E767